MTAIRGAAAAVTGAASGIGRALALELAARGCDLALADRDEAGLQSVAAEIAKAHSLERFQAKWSAVRVKKTRQIKNLEPRFDQSKRDSRQTKTQRAAAARCV